MLKAARRILSNEVSYLVFTVTARCNAFCDFCWNWKNVEDAGKFRKPGDVPKRSELTIEEIEKISRSCPPLLHLQLGGGEPFLRQDLDQIVRLFHRNNGTPSVTLTTNGFLTEQIIDQVDSICGENPGLKLQIFVSLDGWGEFHNHSRKVRNGFDKILETSRKLRELRVVRNYEFSVTSNTVQTSQNENHLEAFLVKLMALDIFDDISLDIARGSLKDDRLKKVNLDIFRKCQELLRCYSSKRTFRSRLLSAVNQNTRARVMEAAQSSHRVFSCFAGSKFLSMDDVGNVYPCEILESHELGNIRDYDFDFAALLSDSRARESIEFIRAKKCHCTWECAIDMESVYDPKMYPKILYTALKDAILRR